MSMDSASEACETSHSFQVNFWNSKEQKTLQVGVHNYHSEKGVLPVPDKENLQTNSWNHQMPSEATMWLGGPP